MKDPAHHRVYVQKKVLQAVRREAAAEEKSDNSSSPSFSKNQRQPKKMSESN